VRAPVLDPTDERGVETGLWSSYLGTVRRKGRKQRSQTYHYRATSRRYPWSSIARKGPSETSFCRICRRIVRLWGKNPVKNRPVRVLASDLDTHVLKLGQDGMYPLQRLREIDPEHLVYERAKPDRSHGVARVLVCVWWQTVDARGGWLRSKRRLG